MIAADDRHRETSVSYLSDGLEAMTDQPEPQRGFINQPRVAPQRGATLGYVHNMIYPTLKGLHRIATVSAPVSCAGWRMVLVQPLSGLIKL